MKKGMKMPARFFGQEPISEALGFPEFAWNLEGDVIVRDGVELRPAENYIDEQTVSVSLLMVFFVPAVQVIALPSPLCPGRCSHDGKGEAHHPVKRLLGDGRETTGEESHVAARGARLVALGS